MVALILVPLFYYGFYLVQRGPLPLDPQVIAHRGGPVNAPENTLAAFQEAIAAGVDWIEMDVQMTRDGALVIMHDETVDRTTDGTGRVRDLTLDQIRALDAGDGEQVPTFEQVIALAKDAGVGLLPEVKSPRRYPGIGAKMVQAIEELDYVERTVIQSFEHNTLESIKKLSPEMQVCPLYGLGGLDFGNPVPADAEVLCPMAEIVLFYPWMVEQAHDDGRKVFVWFGVIEHPLLMRFLLALGADGLMVDDPAALANVLGR